MELALDQVGASGYRAVEAKLGGDLAVIPDLDAVERVLQGLTGA